MSSVHEGEALQNAAKVSKIGINGLAEKLDMPRSTLYYTMKKERLDPYIKTRAAQILGIPPDHLFSGLYNTPGEDDYTATTRVTGDELRRRKAFGDSGSAGGGLSFVPVFAQAGYSKHYLDPVYVEDLERVHLPNMPFKGDRYRVFEVSDDSMEPTLKPHFHVICEVVEPDFWNTTAQFYIHVVVTDDRIMIKRLYRKDEDTFVLISDNEDFYPQFTLRKEEIRELWLVKRKMDWDMPPPKRFEIKV